MSDWISNAPCRGLTDIFFPIRFRVNSNQAYDLPKEICSTCHFTEPCLRIALAVDEQDDRWGVFGGLDPHERYLARHGMLERRIDG
jgi:hypothetical protein